MRSFKEIKDNYDFTLDDEKRLAEMRPLMEGHVDELMNELSSWIMTTKEAAKFFIEETRRRHVFDAQKAWFLNLFSGKYDHKYYERLIRIGYVHVKNSVDPHFMNKTINIVRNFCINILNASEDTTEKRAKKIISFEKILDINLDIITSSYIEEEIRTYSPVYRVRSVLIDFSEKFTQTTNLVLILALIGLTIGTIGLFVMDVKKLLSGDLASGIISSLGSLLILWVMIELMNTEIAHLKGERIRISIFVGVALVTIIRETMIATLKHEQYQTIYYLIAAVLIIGFVYWLVTKAEERQK